MMNLPQRAKIHGGSCEEGKGGLARRGSACLSSLDFFFLVFLELHLRHLEVSRLGVESEVEPLAYATATAMPDPSHVFNLHHLAQH